MSPASGLTEFLPAYLAEVEELLVTANAQLLAVEAALRRAEPNPRAVRELFRALHTIKGLSAMVDVEPVVAVAHRMETTLRGADRAGGRLAQRAIEPMLAGLRAIEQRVRALADGAPTAPPPPAALLEALDALGEGEGSAGAAASPAPAVVLALEEAVAGRLAASEREQLVRGVLGGRRAVRVDFTPSPERAAAGLTINSVRTRLAPLAEIVKVVPLQVPASEHAPGGLAFALLLLVPSVTSDAALAEAVGVAPAALLSIAAAATPAATAPPAPAAADASELARDELGAMVEDAPVEPQRRGVVRVEVTRLDDAMERLATLIVGRSRLVRAVADLTAAGVDTRALGILLAENARALRDLRAALVRVRMVRVSEVLERLPLIVRGLRRATGKQVRLEVDAGSAELDKAVGERIFPAVVHLVRNAVDHAIEPPQERVARGKNPEGLVRVACFERSNAQLELSVQDDGAGIDREAVAARAGAPAPTTDAALLELLCRPGLSTRDAVTTTSGRGMGMDIVRRVTVTELGGELALATRAGQGTTFTLRVPLSISIVDAFVFECAGQRFAVPVRVVEEIIEVDPAALAYGPRGGGGGAPASAGEEIGLVHRRGAAVPVVQLAARLGWARAAAGTRALIVRRSGEPIAFAVDRMVGQQEIVVRPLEDALVRVPGVSGATDLGDGRATLVLDLAALGATPTTRAARPARAAEAAASEAR